MTFLRLLKNDIQKNSTNNNEPKRKLDTYYGLKLLQKSDIYFSSEKYCTSSLKSNLITKKVKNISKFKIDGIIFQSNKIIYFLNNIKNSYVKLTIVVPFYYNLSYKILNNIIKLSKFINVHQIQLNFDCGITDCDYDHDNNDFNKPFCQIFDNIKYVNYIKDVKKFIFKLSTEIRIIIYHEFTCHSFKNLFWETHKFNDNDYIQILNKKISILDK